MENMLLFLTVAVTAVFMENTIFARSLGLTRNMFFMKNTQNIFIYGTVFTVIVVLSSCLTYFVNSFFFGAMNTNVIRFFLYLVCVIIVYLVIYFYTKNIKVKIYDKIKYILHTATFNTALMSVFYISALEEYNFANSIAYAIGTGVGYTMALIVIFYARKRLSISPIPRSFRGVPILLLYMGLISLAIYGLIGFALPN